MKVAKFGGSSLACANKIEQVCDIVASDSDRRILVVSAPGKRDPADTKVTDLLINAARARLAGESGLNELEKVVTRYADIAADLDLPEMAIKPIADDLHERLASNIDDQGVFLDTVKAGGEENSARLIAFFLTKRGMAAKHVNPAEGGMILSQEPGNARVLDTSYHRLRTLRNRSDIVVFPGFFGYSETGKVATFSRGGSDITGAILAAAVNADLYENFTDVDSVFVANPELIKNPAPVNEITYREMRELAYAGFSVLHAEALEPVFRAGIPVEIKNSNNPQSPGTRITLDRESSGQPIVGIAATDGFCTVYVSKYLMNRQVGFGRRLLQLFEDEDISFEHTPTGIDNFSVIVREADFTNAAETRVVQRIRTELAADEVSVARDLALVMVVGEGMSHTIGLAAKACTAFARTGVNIEMINQGSSEVSLMFGINSHDIPAAVLALYQEFFG